jgi:hypothetical protein
MPAFGRMAMIRGRKPAADALSWASKQRLISDFTTTFAVNTAYARKLITDAKNKTVAGIFKCPGH